jgi:uncharacterized cupin superfamily protein
VTDHLVKTNDLTPTRREIGELKSRWTDLGTAAGSRTVGLRRIQVDPGARSTPPHAHGGEEEIFYVLGGSGLLWQDAEVCEVRAGDCIVHRADEHAHTLRAGPEGLDVLAFGQRMVVETCWHPHTRKVWVGPTLADTDGPADMFELDARAGPVDFAAPGPRPANVAATADVPVQERAEGDCHWASRDLGTAAGSERTGLRHNTTRAGHLNCPPHCHSAEEEIFVVLDGDGWALLGDDEAPVGPGHVLARPAGTGVAHALRAGADGITYLAYGTREPNDICYYPRSNKVAFWGVGLIARIERLDYWDGERGFAPRP